MGALDSSVLERMGKIMSYMSLAGGALCMLRTLCQAVLCRGRGRGRGMRAGRGVVGPAASDPALACHVSGTVGNAQL